MCLPSGEIIAYVRLLATINGVKRMSERMPAPDGQNHRAAINAKPTAITAAIDKEIPRFPAVRRHPRPARRSVPQSGDAGSEAVAGSTTAGAVSGAGTT